MEIKNNTFYKKNPAQVSFGRIEPHYLHVKMDGFLKNDHWAKSMVNVIEKYTPLAEKLKFSKLLKKIASDYGKFVKNNDNCCFSNNNQKYFGKFRNLIDYIPFSNYTPVAGKYTPYSKRLNSLFTDQKTGHLLNILKYTQIKAKINNKEYSFYKILISNESIKEKLNTLEKFSFFITPPNPGKIRPALKRADQLKKEAFLLKQELNQNNSQEILNKINSKMAEIHWLLSQAMPFKRGTAGIADISIRTLYEGLNIQTSGWKKGIAPDLEAICTPLEKYIENYTNLFEKTPYFNK